MKKSKIVLIILAAAIFISLSVSCIISPKIDYAVLYPEADSRSYIMLNDETKYCYLMYYDCNYSFDQKLREGENIILSQFNEGFKTSSGDTERNFIYCPHGEFGYQAYGLYVKESYIDELFKLSNIYEVVITTKDGKQILKFNANDKKVFDYFIESYSDELKDYHFPSKGDDVYNDDYDIDVYYQNGEVSRWLRSIDRNAVEKLEEYIR